MVNYFRNLLEELVIRFQKVPEEFVREAHVRPLPFFAQDPIEELKTNPESKELYEKYFSDKTSFEKIIDSACGMYCLKMILKFVKDLTPSTVELAKECMDSGGYVIEENGRLSGMVYKPFKEFIKSKFNLDSEVCSFLSITRIKYEISHRNFVIASVHWDIKDSKNSPKFKGGHLVVITGYDLESLYLNNPGGYENSSQMNYRISFADFKKFFASRGIVILN